ncbi:MAG: efflux RND transporter periplasmic adaptor subunit [Planctomycetaceae bacterium]|nr:efflux RND transporter periplasmic adaptor subunit [Planctomycetaceae bacterium]
MNDDHDERARPEQPIIATQPLHFWKKSTKLVATLMAVGLIFSGTFFVIGYAQRAGWIEKIVVPEDASTTTRMEGVQYICPMMCVPPTDEPGRCPVCEMELVAASMGPVFIDPAMRRVLNIQTVPVAKAAQSNDQASREIHAVGELAFDEQRLKTIAAYVDGRIEQLHASYTGVKVSAGQSMAVIYSPPLFVAQKELLVAKRNSDRMGEEELNAASLYATSRRRLIELGMTASQIESLESTGEASNRLDVVAPIGGTVIEKLAVEGQYVSQGDPIYRLANLEQVWLILKLFPADAAALRTGQSVAATIDSSPGRTFAGTIEFISPSIDRETRTVSVRVVLQNPSGDLRIGDYARATIPIRNDQATGAETATPLVSLPRDAVLLMSGHSVVYVETEPGRFEMREIKIGTVSGREVFVLEGLREGEIVARRGNFLIDSQMQLAGNPSLIDPGKAKPKKLGDELTPEMETAIAALTPDDQVLAKKQRICAVADQPLGSMGVPVRVEIEGQVVFLCCEGCRSGLLKSPEKYLSKLPK